jgi:hypothetical protein
MSTDLYGPGAAGPAAPSLVVKHRAARSYPRVACAGCGALITDVKMAGVAWPPGRVVEESVSPVVVLCKERHCLASDPRWLHWYWMPLDHYLVWLIENTGGHPAKKLRRLIADADRYAEFAG